MRRPLLCRLGWHTHIYRDGALFNSADRCGRCDEWIDKVDGAAVDYEREAWDMAAKRSQSGRS
jgi:hypothetical protein